MKSVKILNGFQKTKNLLPIPLMKQFWKLEEKKILLAQILTLEQSERYISPI